MNDKIAAVLIDTISIQKYVFAGNSLKENLGASYLVENIYASELKETLEKIFGREVDIDYWREEPEKLLLHVDATTEYEIGYIGGGNALIFFRSIKLALDFVKSWTRGLLVKAPGLQTAVAIEESFDFKDYKAGLDGLYKQLIKNKNSYFPNTHLSQYGITADCSRTGFSAEIYHHDLGDLDDLDSKKSGYISSVSKAKFIAADKEDGVFSDYRSLLGNKHTFTNRIDRLGQREGESHIAVVHIDGNSIGERFKQCKDLPERRNLSQWIDKTTKDAFGELLGQIIEHIDDFIAEENGFKLHRDEKNKKLILPIRPLVLKGDDITFITDGRLGVHFAQKFIGYFIKSFAKLTENSKQAPISVCAGVAITKTKYPFYRSYQIAEELCANAKKEARRNENTSWLDFCVVYGGFSGGLEEIRERHHQVRTEGSKLYFGPYLVSGTDEDDEKRIENLTDALKELSNRKKWPRSKLKELRAALPLGRETTEKVVSEMKARGQNLPEVTGGTNYKLDGWDNSVTPYFELIELLEFYPKWLLSK